MSASQEELKIDIRSSQGQLKEDIRYVHTE